MFRPLEVARAMATDVPLRPRAPLVGNILGLRVREHDPLEALESDMAFGFVGL